MRTHVDLCTGIGGFSLGFIAAQLSEPVLLCDFDEKVRKLLRVRFPEIPIANDVKEIANDPARFIHERPFILSAGYPCQPFSQSGKRKGEEDPRHIFPAIAEIVAQTRPSWCVFENVYGHISLGIDKVLGQMGSLDYATATFIVPAACFRPHKRDRLWIICKNLSDTDPRCSDRKDKEVRPRGEAFNFSSKRVGGADVVNSKDIRPTFSPHEEQRKGSSTRYSERKLERGSADVPNTRCEHGQEGNTTKLEQTKTKRPSRQLYSKPSCKGSRGSEVTTNQTFASFRGIFDGISDWLDEPRHIQRTTYKNEYRAERLKQLGNALLPQITYRIGLAIKEVEENK